MANLPSSTFTQFFDNNGDPLASGKVYTYIAGTTTNKATYTTAAGTVSAANPIILDAYGRCKFYLGSGAYDLALKTSADTQIATIENVVGNAGLVGSSISVVSTIAELRALTAGVTDFAYVNLTQTTATGFGVPTLFYWYTLGAVSDNGWTQILPDSSPATGGWIACNLGGYLQLGQYVGSTLASTITLQKARGNKTTPADVENADEIFALEGFAYSGSFLGTAKIVSEVAAAVTTAQRPASNLKFYTNAANGSITLALTIDKDQVATFAKLLTTAASTTASAGLNLPHGTAPTSPVNGDVWTTTAGLYVRVNGSTVGPLS